MPALLESLLLVTAAKALPASRNHLRRVLEAGFGYLGAGDHSGYFVGAGAVVGLGIPYKKCLSSTSAMTLDVLAQGEVHAGLVALALALEPVDNVGVYAQREWPLDGTVKRASDRIAPVGDGRHVGGIDLTVRHRGKSIQFGLQLGRKWLWITSLHSPSSHGLALVLR
jgi:hypothetical protein